LKFGVGLFQPDRDRNDATYRPLAQHLAQRLGRPVELRTVDSWEGLAKSLANGETDIALMGPWGYVLANHASGAQAVSTILYDGKPEYFALIVTHPDSGLSSAHDLLTKGILAIALHSMGTYGKLYAESIEALDMASIDAVRATGASPPQVFFNAVWPAVLPQFVGNHLYIWEFNIRDSTILGLIGAGGLGLLISEAVSLFQWSRLATILLVVIALVMLFDALSRRIRQALL